MNKKSKIITIAVAVFIIVAAIALIVRKKIELAKLKPAKQYAVIVKTMKPKQSHFILTLTSLGIVKSSTDASISTKIASRILYMKQLGDRVKQGEIIAELDSSSVEAKLLSTKAILKSLKSKLSSVNISLRNAIETHKRTKELLDVKGASIEQYQKEQNIIANIKSNISAIRANIKSTKSNIKELNTLLSYTIIKSPVDGIISKKFFNAGDVAMPGKPIYNISSNGIKYVLIRLPSNIQPKAIQYRSKLYPVIALKGTFNGLNEYKSNINVDLNTDSRIEIKVVIFNSTAIKLPMDTILNDNSKSYVFVVRNNKAYPQLVHIAASGEEGVAVLDNNLLGKEIVVAKPDILLKLKGGVSIKKEQ